MPKNTRKAYGLGLSGPLPDLAPMPQLATRNPIPSDDDYELQTVWINTTTDKAFMYTGAGIWTPLGVTGSGILTMTGDAGGAVGADLLNNINIVGGTNVTTSGNPLTNTITINAAISDMTWNVISSSQTLLVNNGYFCIGGGDLTLLLPAISQRGDQIIITLDGSTSWTITLNAGQTIRLGNQETNLRPLGSMTSEQQGDTVILVCQTANLKWTCIGVVGNIIIV